MSYCQLLDLTHKQHNTQHIFCFISGKSGTGKTSSIAMLASDWANLEDAEEAKESSCLNQFDFVFLIELRYVNDNSSLENVIIKQHGLSEKTTDVKELLSILEGCKVLLLLDGYDEYAEGTNDDVDSAIENTIGDCFLLLTCRDGDDYLRPKIRNMFDGEIELHGFGWESKNKYVKNFFDNATVALDVFKQSHASGIHDLLNRPMILLMVCVLLHERKQLPKSQTEIMSEIVQICMDRSCLKHFGKRARDMVGLEHILYRLGEVAWKALRRKTRQLLVHKV